MTTIEKTALHRNVDEMRDLRAALESAIKGSISAFETATGLQVDSVRIERNIPFEGPRQVVNVKATVTV